MPEYVFLLEDLVITKDGEQEVHVDSIIDDEWEYTGRYKAMVNNYVTELQLDNDAFWIEKGKGRTNLAAQIGRLIEDHSE